MSTRIQIRRGTAAQWTASNPVLADGEMGWERDTDKVKVGDGVTAWTALPYFGGVALSVDGNTGVLTIGGSTFDLASQVELTAHSTGTDPHGDRAYTDTRVAALVNSAPAILDTLGEIAAQLQSDESAAAALTTAVAGKQNVVVHGSNAVTARPAGATVVHWIGSVAPTNAVTNDEWSDTANKLLKRWNGSAWDAFGSGASSTAAALTAQPWQANQTYSTGQVVSQAGALYTSPSNFTAGASFNAANWSVGVASGAQVYEQNGTGQVIAIWSGNGLGTAASKIIDVALSGLFVPGGTWAVGTAYSADTIVTRNGSGYLAVASSTGIDPATDNGTHWQVIASKGDTGATGPTGSATADGAVLSRHLADLARSANAGWLIGSGFTQNYRRDDAGATVTTATRQLLSSGGLVLPGGRAVTALRVIPTTVIGTPLHQFVALYNARTLALLASGTDVTTQAMTANVDITFPISYTPTNGVEVLAVYYCEATTTPVFAGKGSTTALTLAPRMGGLHDTLAAGSGPAALPTTLGAATAGKGPFWVQAE